MSSGTETLQFRLVEIAFPLFAINPAYENAVFTTKEVAWTVTIDFFVEKIDEEWSELMIKVIITLRTVAGNKKIAEMITQSTYEVSAGISMEGKKTLLHITINQTAAHAQGAWRMKHQNQSIATILPQVLEKFERDSKVVADLIKRKWGKWSNK